MQGTPVPASREGRPRRIQRKRVKGWRMPEGAVYVGRGSRWGNPWRVWRRTPTEPGGRLTASPSPRQWVVKADHEAHTHDFAAQQEAVDYAVLMHASWVRRHADAVRADLAGRDLACWCPLDQPCHADVLLRIANGGGA